MGSHTGEGAGPRSQGRGSRSTIAPDTPTGTRRRSWSRRALALLIGLGLALVAAELTYRLTRLGGLGPTTNPVLVRHDDELGWSYRPGARARHRTSEFDVAVEINARGFRGPEWFPAVTGERRLLLLGDSLAFGWGVEHDQTLGAKLEESAPGWRVMNAAVSGYGTGQELQLLRRLLADPRVPRPDVVVCVFCENDLFENGSPAVYGKRKPWFELAGERIVLRGVPAPRSWLERASHLFNALAKLAWQRRFERAARDRAADWRLTLQIYAEMRRALAPSLPLVILSEHDELELFARTALGIEHLDLRPALEAAREVTTFPIDGHWNAAGHAAVARALAARLRELDAAGPPVSGR